MPPPPQLQLRSIILDAMPETTEEMAEFQSDVEELVRELEREISSMKDG